MGVAVELIYLGPAESGPPPSGWLWYEKATRVSFFQLHGADVLIPDPPVLVTAEGLAAARRRAGVAERFGCDVEVSDVREDAGGV